MAVIFWAVFLIVRSNNKWTDDEALMIQDKQKQIDELKSQFEDQEKNRVLGESGNLPSENIPVIDQNDTETSILKMPDSLKDNDSKINSKEEKQKSDFGTTSNKAKENNRAGQSEISGAQLAVDEAAYYAAIDKLTRDYNHEVAAINAATVEEGAYKIDHDCADGTMDEQNCQVIQRKYEKYKVELEYLEDTYKANLRTIEATKYW